MRSISSGWTTSSSPRPKRGVSITPLTFPSLSHIMLCVILRCEAMDIEGICKDYLLTVYSKHSRYVPTYDK